MKTEEKILNATVELLKHKSSGLISVRKIGEEAGVSNNSYLNYWNNIEDLMFDAWQELIKEVDQKKMSPEIFNELWIRESNCDESRVMEAL